MCRRRDVGSISFYTTSTSLVKDFSKACLDIHRTKSSLRFTPYSVVSLFPDFTVRVPVHHARVEYLTPFTLLIWHARQVVQHGKIEHAFVLVSFSTTRCEIMRHVVNIET